MITGNFLVLVLINLISLNIISHVQAIAKEVSPDFEQVGEASWYGPGFHGRKTANGERFDTYEMTAAHKTLPFNTLVKVTNLQNDVSIVVRINDRGPFVKGRIIDLSKAAKEELQMGGLAKVRLEIYNPEEEIAETEESQENLAPLNLFDEMFPSTSKIFVEWNGSEEIDGELTDEQLSSILSAPKIKIKVLTPDVADASLKIYEEASENAGMNYFDITNKVRFINGYSIEVENFDNQKECDKLIARLETEKFNNIFLEEMYSGTNTIFKVLVGNYAKPEDAKEDIIRILNLGSNPKAKLVMIGG
jgi:rare lipoprotein A